MADKEVNKASKKKSKPRSSLCTKCNKKGPILCCSACSGDFHLQCVNVSKDVHMFFKSNDVISSGFRWLCESCRMDSTLMQEANTSSTDPSTSESRDDRYEKLFDMVLELGKKFEVLESTIKASGPTPKQQHIKPKMTLRSNNIITSVSNGGPPTSDLASSYVIDEEEMKQRDRKKMNLCMFNIPESSAMDDSECYSDDMIKLKSILFPRQGFNPEHVQHAFRIGKKSDHKIRPIVIKFTDEETRLNVLKMKDLTYTENSEIVNIYVNVDKTKQQVLEHKKLLQELMNRRDSGETNLVIRNGKIVQKQPFRPSPQSVWNRTLQEQE